MSCDENEWQEDCEEDFYQCVSTKSVERPRKRWMDEIGECAAQKGRSMVDVEIMMYELNVWKQFVEGRI